MRTLLATAVALLTASAAHAQTINLQPTGNDSGKRLYVEVHRASGWSPIDVPSMTGVFYSLDTAGRTLAEVWAYRANGQIEGPPQANGKFANSVIYGGQAKVGTNGSGSRGDGRCSVSVSANAFTPTGQTCNYSRTLKLNVDFGTDPDEPSTLTAPAGCIWQPGAQPFDDIRLAYGIPPAAGSTPTIITATATVAPPSTATTVPATATRSPSPTASDCPPGMDCRPQYRCYECVRQ